MRRGGEREAVRAALARIVEAPSLEALFAGSDDEAATVYRLLPAVADGAGGALGHEVRRLARRRGVASRFLVDRAAAFRRTMEARRADDLYRLLGVPPLATADVVERRWAEITRCEGREGADERRRLRAARDILRDPERRARYEGFWRRALWPFERVALGPLAGSSQAK